MASKAPFVGEALQILQLKQHSSEIVVIDAALNTIEANLKAAKADVVSILSVMGEYRTGKSFLMGFIIRFLTKFKALRDARTKDSDLKGKLYAARDDSWKYYMDGRKNNPIAPWIKEGDAEKLRSEYGFAWRHGEDRCTEGVWLWSQPFVFTDSQGRKVGVLLMDTQGAYDDSMSRAQSATIFGMTALMSSKLIYNIQNRLSAVDFDKMDYFTTFAEKVTKDLQGTPFGQLHCLVRDWCNYDEETSMQHCQDEMNEQLAKHMDSKHVRKDSMEKVERLQKCFKSISCFALSEPGRGVKREDYDGEFSVIDNDFFQFLDKFMELVFSDGFPCASSPGGTDIGADELKSTIKNFAQVFGEQAGDMAISLRKAFVNVQMTKTKDAMWEQFRGELHSEAPEIKVFDPPKLKAICDGLEAKYTEKFAEELKVFRLKPEEEKEQVDKFKDQMESIIEPRLELNAAALEGAQLKLALSPVIVFLGHFLAMHQCVMGICAIGGGAAKVKRKTDELQKPVTSPEVWKGIANDTKEFGRHRIRDCQAIAVAAKSCSPKTTMNQAINGAKGLSAMASVAAASNNATTNQ